MITDICIVFGCGVKLTALEKLCGNVCTMHQDEQITAVKMIVKKPSFKLRFRRRKPT